MDCEEVGMPWVSEIIKQKRLQPSLIDLDLDSAPTLVLLAPLNEQDSCLWSAQRCHQNTPGSVQYPEPSLVAKTVL
jgi:hypothetical protein